MTPEPSESRPGAPPSRRTTSLLYRLADAQVRRPWAFLAVAALVVAGSLALATRLQVVPGFEALLPKSRASVQELERVKERTSGVSTAFVVLEGDDTAALRRAADAIVVEASAIGYPWVGAVESGVHESVDFLAPRVGLFADLDKLRELHSEVLDRYDYEVAKAAGTLLDDDDDAPPELDPEELKKRFGLSDDDLERYPDGYYQSKDGKAVVVAIRSGVMGTDYRAASEAMSRIHAAVEKVNPASHHPSIRYGFAGDLVTGLNEFKAINNDLTEVGALGSLLLIGVVFLYYLRVRTLLAMVLTVGSGVAVTFGATQLLVGQLNMATGFLFTIVAGNGINSGIILMARFLEERRKGARLQAAIRVAHRDTWAATLTAASAAGAAYASLIATEFRGFHDFGIIGGAGMLLCWLCTYAFMPALLVVSERVAPIDENRGGLFGLLPKAAAGGVRFGVPFAAIISRAPRAATLLGSAATLLAAAISIVWVAHDPMEYDMRNLRTDMSARAEEVRLGDLAVEVTGHVGADGMAILTERVEQVPLLIAELEKRRDQAPEDAKPFKSVHALQDFVPADQAEKIPLLLEIKDRVLRVRKHGGISDEDFAHIERFLPSDDLKPFGIEELPTGLARPFTERDGTRGRVVYIAPLNPDIIDDAKYLFRWADSYRHTELPDGSVVLGSGRAVIYADIWSAVLEDVPLAVVLSLAMTLLVVALSFRGRLVAGLVIVALLGGVAWMTGLLAAGGVRLNFLNFIALPLTFGIGVDYAVNIMQRYLREGAGGMLTAVRETGGAVVLCSATTALGYLALTTSVNYAVRSMGIAAVIGELTCLVTAVVLLPAALVWRDRRRASSAGVTPDQNEMRPAA